MKNKFKKYGFEKPDFQSKIFTKTDLGYLGIIKVDNKNISVIWNEEGLCFELGLNNGAVACPSYNLAPILTTKKKKEVVMYKYALIDDLGLAKELDYFYSSTAPIEFRFRTDKKYIKRLDYTKTIFEVDYE